MPPNVYAQFDPQPAPARPGFTPLSGQAPGYARDMATLPLAVPTAAADLADKQATQQHTILENNRMRAQAQTDGPMAQAALIKAQSDGIIAQQKADEAKANTALATMTPNSDLHGDAYLQKFVPPNMWNTVKAYARGDLGSRSGGLSTSMLPIIQYAMNYDPTTSGTNFPARVKMQSDLAGSAPNTAGGSLRSMEQMLLHGNDLLNGGQSLNNFGPGIIGSAANSVRTMYDQAYHDPTLSAYNQDVLNYAPESQKGVAGTAGVGPEREGRAASFAPSAPQASRVAALQSDAQMAYQRMGAVNDQYHRIMGRDITDQLSPAARAAYDNIMAGGYDKNGNALFPAKGYVPGSILAQGGGAGPGNPGNPSAPGNPGTPGGFNSNPLASLPGDGSGSPMGSLATTPTRLVDDPKAGALINALVRRGAGADEINSALTPLGYPPVDAGAVTQWQSFLKSNPGFKGLAGGGAQRPVATSLYNRVAGSPVGTGIGAGIDAALGGTTDEIAGGVNSLLTGKPLGASIAEQNAAKQAAFAANPKATTVGDLLGGTLGYVGAGKLLGGTALAAGLGRAAPYAGAAAFGAASGAGQDNNNRLGGAVGGAVGGLVGAGIGAAAAVPVGAIARTRPVQALGRMFGRGLDVAPMPTPAQSSALSAINIAGPDAVRSSLADASNLGVPMSLADTSPNLRELAGAAVRRSPTASGFAEDALLSRNRGQIDRFGSAVTRDLGPISNIPQTSADLAAQAKTTAAPLYAKAYSNPGASSVDLSDLTSKPSYQAGLSQAHNIALEDGVDPTSLGFDLDGQGNVTLNRTPSFQTLDYIKQGMDATLEPHRNLLTGKLDLTPATKPINDTKNTLLSRMDAVNPDYAAARAAYAGPMQSRDALTRGQDAFGLSPDELGMQVQGQSPEQLGQMQTGFRSQLMTNANGIRDAGNPFDAASTLGNPNARARLDALYPNNPGNANLLQQRDLEGQLQQTSNAILGNSKTAQRGIADKAFDMSAIPAAAIDAATIYHGGVPLATAARYGLRTVANSAIGSAVKGQLAQSAIAKADDLAPMLLNTDPSASAATVDDLIKQQAAYQAYVNASRPTAPFRMFGAGIGAGVAGSLAGS